jgi:hypothetical protein
MTAAFQLDPKAALMMGPWSGARWGSPEVMAVMAYCCGVELWGWTRITNNYLKKKKNKQ